MTILMLLSYRISVGIDVVDLKIEIHMCL